MPKKEFKYIELVDRFDKKISKNKKKLKINGNKGEFDYVQRNEFWWRNEYASAYETSTKFTKRYDENKGRN